MSRLHLLLCWAHEITSLDWISTLDRPGVDSDVLNRRTIASMLLAGQTIQQIAMALNVNETHLRLHIEATGHTARQAPVAQSHAQDRITIRRELLAPDRLRQLHEEEKRSQGEIAAQAGCYPRTVRTALVDAQIPICSPLQPKTGLRT
ncbi:hypothetical protein E1267_22275 [Nonomuraea longispora]|uniref:Uncharacterized protein n=1 Tax=Nonomuraea longispora TaxID=1848320 RepID=A0A4R4N775_9ACTN|nr:hypothetical protein [Nonomuraea longispora]TDC04625.1 hypothetical protein E1267_22275 [Nonomuraea longispora]